MIELLAVILIPAVVYSGAIAVGRLQERAHERRIVTRNAEFANIVVSDLDRLPAGMEADRTALVTGSVVVASDYGKQLAFGFRTLIGGRVRSFERMLSRGRAEARLRMLADARSHGATVVLNARFETSRISRFASEVFCYGTAVHLR